MLGCLWITGFLIDNLPLLLFYIQSVIISVSIMKDHQALTPRHCKNLQEGQKKIEKYVFSLNKVIGKGSYATVYRGRRITDDLPTAVKVIDKKIFANTYNIKSIQSEIQIMKKVDHPNIVKLLDVYQTNNNMYIVTQFCQGGDLRNYIRKKRKLCEAEALQILNNLMSGFRYLNNLDIIHRDLKPANILINNGVCKISDFGFAKNLEDGENTVMKSIVGTPLYMSPQILNKRQYTNKSDLWSIGLIYYEMIHGQTPWPANSQLQLINRIMTVPVRFDPNTRDQSKDFIKRCLKIKQEDRMSWQDAFNHPVLNMREKSQQMTPKKRQKQNISNRNQDIISTKRVQNKSKSKSAKKKERNTGKTPTRLTITPSKVPTPRRMHDFTPERSPWRF